MPSEAIDTELEPLAHPVMAEEEDLDQFLEQLADSLAPEASSPGGTLSFLDNFGHDGMVQPALKQPFSGRDLREVQARTPPPSIAAKLIRTPEQIMQQLFQRSDQAQMPALPACTTRSCSARPLQSVLNFKVEALPGGSSSTAQQRKGDPASPLSLLSELPSPGGEASSSNVTVAARDFEPGTRSDTSEAPAKPKKKPRKKTDVWRLNNQLAQKRFRQKQKEKQQAQQERVVELSERVADLQQKHRSLHSMLEAYQQVEMQECARTGCVLSLELLQVALTMQQVLDMDLRTIASIWQAAGAKVGACLLEVERCPSTVLLSHLQALGCEALELLHCLHEHNPGVLASFTAASAKGWDIPKAGYRGMQGPWQHVLEQLKLSQRQRAALQGVHERLLESVARLASQRTALTSELQAIPGEAGVFRQALLVKELHQNAQATFVHNFALAPLAYLQNRQDHLPQTVLPWPTSRRKSGCTAQPLLPVCLHPRM